MSEKKENFIKGDIDKAQGKCSITVKDITFDFEPVGYGEITDFQQINFKVLKGKSIKEVRKDTKIDDFLAIADNTNTWLFDFFLKRLGTSIKEQESKQDKEVAKLMNFIVRNREEIMKELTIAFGIKTREDYEKEQIEFKEKMKKEQESMLEEGKE